MDVVIDGVNDGSFKKVKKNTDSIRKLTGKRIRADYVSLDTNLSLSLSKARAEKTGRVVPDDIIKKYNVAISSIIPEIIQDKSVFDELYLWDTNIEGNPRLILSMVDGILRIEDSKLYAQFLAKAH